jgi:ADP-ribose pyrophosphatase YjhB (NUDIX family)
MAIARRPYRRDRVTATGTTSSAFTQNSRGRMAISNEGDTTYRRAARAVLVDPSDRILLVHLEDHDRGASWWATPGGGLRLNETHEEAVAREVAEETGLTEVEVGPCIWLRTHVFSSAGIRYRQDERFFLVRTPPFSPRAATLDETEARYFRSLRWWSISELEATRDELSPSQLPTLLRSLLDSGPPPSLIVVGV